MNLIMRRRWRKSPATPIKQSETLGSGSSLAVSVGIGVEADSTFAFPFASEAGFELSAGSDSASFLSGSAFSLSAGGTDSNSSTSSRIWEEEIFHWSCTSLKLAMTRMGMWFGTASMFFLKYSTESSYSSTKTLNVRCEDPE